MTDFPHVLPRSPAPRLRLALAGGGTFDLHDDRSERFTLVTFYRGLHCPICKNQLGELERKRSEFAERGVTIVAASMDDRERAERAKAEWEISGVPVAYGLSVADARAWGLYLSSGRGVTSAGVDEPAVFSEPALFLIRADGTLYFSSVQTMPFARPRYPDILAAIDYVVQNDYPARGELAAAEAIAR